MTNNLIKMTEKKRDGAIESGSDLVGFVTEKNGKYQIFAHGRVINLSKKEFERLIMYPES